MQSIQTKRDQITQRSCVFSDRMHLKKAENCMERKSIFLVVLNVSGSWSLSPYLFYGHIHVICSKQLDYSCDLWKCNASTMWFSFLFSVESWYIVSPRHLQPLQLIYPFFFRHCLVHSHILIIFMLNFLFILIFLCKFSPGDHWPLQLIHSLLFLPIF